MSEPTVDPERLAAFLDGRLSEAERKEVVRLLAESPDALEIHADAAALLHELEAESAPVATLPVPRKPWLLTSPGILAMAAVVAFAAITPLVVRSRQSSPAMGVGTAASSLADASRGLPAGWNTQPWSSTRAAGAALTLEARSVRAGARLADLETAVRAGDSVRTVELANGMVELLSDLPAAGPATASLMAVATRAGAPAADLLPRLATVRMAVALVVDSVAAARGSWLEAGRLAAARGDAAFLRSASFESTTVGAVDAADRAIIARVASEAPAPGSPAWSEVETLLSRILARLAR